MKTYQPEVLRKSLSKAKSYRDFLRTYFEVTSIPYAEVARRAGFSSRSYPRDVTEGRRRLTSRSLPTLIRGLKLEPRLSELLQLLFFQEYPEEFNARSGVLLQRSVTEIQNHLASRIEQTRKRANSAAPVRKNLAGTRALALGARPSEELIRHLFEILASLGNPQQGATLEDLRRMTGLERSTLATILEVCAREGLVRVDAQTSRYYPAAGHLNLTGMPKNELIRRIFLQSLDRAKMAADTLYNSDEALFFVSAISVGRSDLPKLKEEIRGILLRYADAKVEDTPEPDTVVYLVGSMFEARQA